jgi:uncharacterized protein
MLHFLRHFPGSAFATVAALVAVGIGMGPGAALTTLILIAIEIAFSFDNAIINAKVLERLSKLWQQLFLTIGMVLAIVGMRFVFPIVIVALAAHLPWNTVLDLAVNKPEQYAQKLHEAHGLIAAFGGAFLLTLSLYFFLDRTKGVHWLDKVELPMKKAGSWWLPLVVSVALVALISIIPGNQHPQETLEAGLLGVATYTGIKLFIDGLEKLAGTTVDGLYTGWAAFGAFMYLQVLDASFSFDGVVGAFAITNMILLIAAGLGIGALWVRSLTVYMVRKGTLKSYIYLEHGAHYAIAFLALALYVSIFWEVPDAITGIVGVGVLVSSFLASREALHARNGK